MKLYVVIVAATLLIACSCDPTIPKNSPKRQAQLLDGTTPPCSLSVYRYLFNKSGTKIRPNLPAGTVIFGRALSGLDDNAIGDTLEESGSKIDATEIKPDEGDSVLSASEPKIGNNYLPPPPNPSINDDLLPPSKQGRPNYIIPIGSIDVTSAPEIVHNGSPIAGAIDDAVVVSSTSAPDISEQGSSTLLPDVGSSTLQPEIPISSTIEPDVSGLFSPTPSDLGLLSPADLGLPSPTLSPEYPIFSPSPSPDASLPFYPASNPGLPPVSDQLSFSSHCKYPINIIDGTRCICEDGKVFFTPHQNYPLSPFNIQTNQLINGITARGPGLVISSTEKPVTSLKPIVIAPQLNENNIEYSYPTPKPFVTLISANTPPPELPQVFSFSTPAPPVLVSSAPTSHQPHSVTIISSTPKPEFSGSESSQLFPEFPLPLPSAPAFELPKVYASYQPLLATFPPPSPQPSLYKPILQQPQPVPSVFTFPSSPHASGYRYPLPSIPFPLPSPSTPAPPPPPLTSDGYQQHPKSSIGFPLPTASSAAPSPPPPAIYIPQPSPSLPPPQPPTIRIPPPPPPPIIRIPLPPASSSAPSLPLPSIRVPSYPAPPPPPSSGGYQYPKPSISFPLPSSTSAPPPPPSIIRIPSPSPQPPFISIPSFPPPPPPTLDYRYPVPSVPSTSSPPSPPPPFKNGYQIPASSAPFSLPPTHENKGYSYPKPQIPFDLPNKK